MLATLIRQLGDFQLAEDALQDAFAAAIVAWERDGVPQRPGAWITTTARRKAIDRLRRDRVLADRVERLGHARRARDAAARPRRRAGPSAIGDDRLRLIFTCCHPALAMPARVALTLRSLGGLTTGEIARAFLVEEAAMAQRIVRAKRKIATAPHPLPDPAATRSCPTAWRACSPSSTSSSTRAGARRRGDRLVRGELCAEAIRLGRLLVRLMPDDPEVAGLLALMLLHDSRRDARVDEHGDLVALDDQDRSLLGPRAHPRGHDAARRARCAAAGPGPTSCRRRSPRCTRTRRRREETDHAQIAALYGELARRAPSPVIDVNRAAALGRAGPRRRRASRCCAPLLADAALARYAPLHAAHADLLDRSGDAPRRGARVRDARPTAPTTPSRARSCCARARSALRDGRLSAPTM